MTNMRLFVAVGAAILLVGEPGIEDDDIFAFGVADNVGANVGRKVF